MKPAEPLDGGVDQRLDLVGLAHVGQLEGGGVTEVGGHLLAPLGVDVGDDDLGALGHEPLGGRLPDAGGAPGDDGDLAVELAGHVRTPAARFGRVVTNWHLICRP